MNGGSADEVRDTVLKVMVSKLSESSLAEKSEQWVEEVFGKLKRGKTSLCKLSAKSPEDLVTVNKAFADGATAEDKKALMKVWLRCLIPKKNYCWLRSYPTHYLQVMMRLIHVDYADSWPTASKEMLVLLVEEWFGSNYRKKKRRREDTEEEEEEVVPVKKPRRVSRSKEVKPKEAKVAEPKAVKEKQVKKKTEAESEAKAKAEKEKKEAAERENSLEVNTIDPSMTAMKDPAPEVTSHLPSLDVLPSTGTELSLDEQKEAMSLISAIKDTIMRGESEVATIADLAHSMGVEQSQVKSAAKMMQKYDEVLYDESLGVVYAV